jgi:hypothetical protein
MKQKKAPLSDAIGSPCLSARLAPHLVTSVITALLTVTMTVSAQTLENLWEITAPDADGNLDTSGLARGLTYNSLSNQVILGTRSGANKCVLYNGDSGAVEGYMNMTGISGGSVFSWNSVACADDGVLYGFNVSATTFKIYRWDSTDTNIAPTVAYGPGDPANGLVLPGARWGDNVAIRGSGTSTEILVSSWGNTNVALFTTTDGTNFSPMRIDIPGINNNDVRDGLAFYTNNTFWAKRINRPLILVRYTATSSLTATGEVIGSYSADPLSPLACNPAADLLASVTFTTPAQLRLYDIAALPPALVAQTNFLASNVNGNGTGAAAFGGTGRTNRLYALWSNNGIKAASIVWNAPPSAPVISGQPGSLTVYTNMSGVTFTVTASGNPAPEYQWYFNGSPVAGATKSFYTKPGPFTTADSGSFIVIVTNSAGADTSTPPAVLNVIEPQLTAVMTPLWAITNGTRAYLQSDNSSRGMAYDPMTTNLVIVSRTGGGNSIYAVSATTGADQFALNTLGITSGGGNGTFGLNMIGVAGDGAVLAGNLRINTADGNFKLYRWGSVDASAIPAYAFDGDPAPGQDLRWGDSLAVRGAGTGTQVIIGSNTGSGAGGSPGQYVALFTTADGSTFTAYPLLAPVGTPDNFAQLGIAFGTNNTFWTKSSGYKLRLFAYDPALADLNLTLLAEYDLPSRLVAATGIAVETNQGVLAAVQVANPDNLQLYRLPTSTNPPVMLDQEFFPTDNANGNATASVAFGTNNTVYALDSNNGLLAMSLNLAATLPALRFTSIAPTTTPDLGTILTWQSLVGGTYQLQYKGDLSVPGGWSDAGSSVVANGPSVTVSDTGTGFTNRFYRVEQKP